MRDLRLVVCDLWIPALRQAQGKLFAGMTPPVWQGMHSEGVKPLLRRSQGGFRFSNFGSSRR